MDGVSVNDMSECVLPNQQNPFMLIGLHGQGKPTLLTAPQNKNTIIMCTFLNFQCSEIIGPKAFCIGPTAFFFTLSNNKVN